MHPHALVGRVVDLLRLPLALVLGVVDHRWLPLSVHLIIPIVGLGSIRVRDVLWFVPVLRLGIVRIGNGCTVVPVFRLLRLRILDLLRWQEVPVFLQATRLHLLVIDQHFVRVVRAHDERVEVREHVVLAADILVDQMILALVAEDHVHLLGARTADVRSEHEQVRRFTVQILLVYGAIEHLQVSATAVDVLLVLDRELHDERVILVGERLELGRKGIEACIL
uniref:Putative secreted protein n=1 Tax=Anopheles darlingi TaxID=43151 RepID=A0A2M4DHF4_ANODA